MMYQAIVSYLSHLICNILNLYRDKVGAGEFFFSKVSSDCKASIPLSINGMDAVQPEETIEKKNSPTPTLSL